MWQLEDECLGISRWLMYFLIGCLYFFEDAFGRFSKEADRDDSHHTTAALAIVASRRP
jgi:hypothetical protein